MRPWRSHTATATGSATVEIHVVRAEHGAALATGSRVTASTTPTRPAFELDGAGLRDWLTLPTHRRAEFRRRVTAATAAIPEGALAFVARNHEQATGCTAAEALEYARGFASRAVFALTLPMCSSTSTSTLATPSKRRHELEARKPSPPCRKPRPRSASKPRRPCAALTALHAHAPPRGRGVKPSALGGLP